MRDEARRIKWPAAEDAPAQAAEVYPDVDEYDAVLRWHCRLVDEEVSHEGHEGERQRARRDATEMP